MKIATITLTNDVHALRVREEVLALRPEAEFSVFEIDRIYGDGGFDWSLSDPGARLTDRDGRRVRIDEIDVIWWRRSHQPQVGLDLDEARQELADRDCRAAVRGLLRTEFDGRFVNDPEASRRAENKLFQLRVAHRLGFETPDTLVSQDPESIRAFAARHDHEIIVKTLKGTSKMHVLTRSVHAEHLVEDEPLRLCPAIYQEKVLGDRHLRVHAFGGSIYAMELRSDHLDWRRELDVPASIVSLPPDLEERIRRLLVRLDLRMGILDFKIRDDAAPVFLELNPQGQFLFCEALTGFNLSAALARFLVREADGRTRAATHPRSFARLS